MKIFKSPVPKNLLFGLFDKATSPINNQYTIDKPVFKKLQVYIPDFLKECSEYYLDSQKKYITKLPFTYKAFCTVLRQICNINHISFHYKIKYFHSDYEIVYYINV